MRFFLIFEAYHIEMYAVKNKLYGSDYHTLLAIDHVYRIDERFNKSANIVYRQQGVMNETPTGCLFHGDHEGELRDIHGAELARLAQCLLTKFKIGRASSFGGKTPYTHLVGFPSVARWLLYLQASSGGGRARPLLTKGQAESLLRRRPLR